MPEPGHSTHAIRVGSRRLRTSLTQLLSGPVIVAVPGDGAGEGGNDE